MRDRGPDTPDDELERVFLPFQRSTCTRGGAGGAGPGPGYQPPHHARARWPCPDARAVIALDGPPRAGRPDLAAPARAHSSLRALRHVRQATTHLQYTAGNAEERTCAITS